MRNKECGHWRALRRGPGLQLGGRLGLGGTRFKQVGAGGNQVQAGWGWVACWAVCCILPSHCLVAVYSEGAWAVSGMFGLWP